MKLFIKRQVSGHTVTDMMATVKLSPLTVLKALAHHPLKQTIAPPNMPDYIALGATGGTLLAGPQAGIKIARNGAYLPFTLEYYRITLAARINADTGDSYDVSSLVCDVNNPNFTAGQWGRSEIVGEAYPNSEPGSQGRSYTPKEKLIYASNASKVVLASESGIENQGVWPWLNSSNGYPNLNGNAGVNQFIEPSFENKALWDLTPLISAVGIFAPQLHTEASICEYYAISIDDTLVSNISALTNDVFISIPSTFGYTAPQFNIINGTGYIGDVRTTQGALQRPLFAENELVMPLSWVLSQTSQQLPASKNVNGIVNPIKPPIGAIAPFAFDVNYNHIATVTTTPAREITLIDPPVFTGAVGPY